MVELLLGMQDIYLSYSPVKVHKEPILVGIVSGKAGDLIESYSDEEIVTKSRQILKDMFRLPDLPRITSYQV